MTRTSGGEIGGSNGPRVRPFAFHENASQNTFTAEAGRSALRMSPTSLPSYCCTCPTGIRTRRHMGAGNEPQSVNSLSLTMTWPPPWQDASLPETASSREPLMQKTAGEPGDLPDRRLGSLL